MSSVNDITSLKEYQEYRKAVDQSEDYKRKVQQMERQIDKRYQAYKSKLKDAGNADSFQDEQELKDEAQELKAEAETLQQQLSEFKEKSPHYGNRKGDAKKKLIAEGRKFITDLEDQAIDKLDEAIAILNAIQQSKQKFVADEVKFIPTVTHKLERLEHIRDTF